MLNISLQIVGSSSLTVKDPGIHHQVGDVTAVYLTSDLKETPSPDSRLVFVHVVDMPVTSIDKVKFTSEPLFSDVANAEGIKPMLHRHEWFFDVTLATPEEITALTNFRQVTVTWPRVKQVMKRRTGLTHIKDTDLDG